jgi:hypothetical protein
MNSSQFKSTAEVTAEVKPLRAVQRVDAIVATIGNSSVSLAPIALGQSTSGLRYMPIVAKFVIVGAITVVVVLRVVFLVREGRVDRINL